MLRHLRFHGRGGEGVKLASRILSRAAFLSGATVQDSPLYGAERRGAPVVAFTRISNRPILERGYIDAPDVVVVMDASLLSVPEAGVLNGVGTATLFLLNAADHVATLARQQVAARVINLDVSSIAIELLGHRLLSAPIVGFVAKVTGIVGFETLQHAVRTELEAAGIGPQQLAANLTATERAYEAAVRAEWTEPVLHPAAPSARAPFRLPRLPARLAAPSIAVEANSEMRHMDGWRVYRPEIDRAGCSRCFLCFALCPEGAIHLDPDNYPEIDLAHCKGCLVCAHECPTHTIHEVREELV